MHKLYKAISKAYIDKAMRNITEKERKRYSLPEVELTEIEYDTMVALAQGRAVNEIEEAIKRLDSNLSYLMITKHIMYKLEAFNMVHATYKAIKLGIISADIVTSEPINWGS